jgi:sec-independent protein translocase protein TatB
MLDIGIWEFLVIGVLALLVFGPDRLPKAAADAGRLLRQLRQSATSARGDLVSAAGLEEGGDLAGVMADLRELDPRRIVDDVLKGEAPQAPQAPQAAPAVRPVAGSPAVTDPRGTAGESPSPRPAPRELADPDWT